MEAKSKKIVNLSAACLIWLFGVLVFLPLADDVNSSQFSMLISIIVFLTFSFFLIRGLKGLRVFIDILSEELRKKLIDQKLIKDNSLIYVKMKAVAEALIIVILYLLYNPLLIRIHQAINGLAAIITLLAVFWSLKSSNKK